MDIPERRNCGHGRKTELWTWQNNFRGGARRRVFNILLLSFRHFIVKVSISTAYL
jgi:hypothetical protein